MFLQVGAVFERSKAITEGKQSRSRAGGRSERSGGAEGASRGKESVFAEQDIRVLA